MSSSYSLPTTYYKLPRGFTVLEALIAVAIIALLSAVVLGSFSGYRNEQALRHETDNVMTLLARARSQSLASIDSSSYGVHIEDDRVVLFKGGSYDAEDGENEIMMLNAAVTISDISLSGGAEAVSFDRRTGDASASGTITLELASDASKQKTITITATGGVSSD